MSESCDEAETSKKPRFPDLQRKENCFCSVCEEISMRDNIQRMKYSFGCMEISMVTSMTKV